MNTAHGNRVIPDNLKYPQHKLEAVPETAFADLTALAFHICHTPIAFISAFDGKAQWLKSQVGLDTTQTQLYLAFSLYAILQPEVCQSGVIIIPDTLIDQRFASHSLVKSPPKIRFYAGLPLVNSEGSLLGVLAVMDYVPRSLKLEQQTAFETLKRIGNNYMELGKNLKKLAETISDRVLPPHEITQPD